jgi:hypothetical protein
VLILSGSGIVKGNQTVAKISNRAEDMVKGTIMHFEATSKTWMPYTDAAQVPTGILCGTVSAGALKAGNVEGISILVGGNSVVVDRALVILEGDAALENVVSSTGVTVEQTLRWSSIYIDDSVDSTRFEN